MYPWHNLSLENHDLSKGSNSQEKQRMHDHSFLVHADPEANHTNGAEHPHVHIPTDRELADGLLDQVKLAVELRAKATEMLHEFATLLNHGMEAGLAIGFGLEVDKVTQQWTVMPVKITREF